MLDLGEKMVRIVCPTRALTYQQGGRKSNPKELPKTNADQQKLGLQEVVGQDQQDIACTSRIGVL